MIDAGQLREAFPFDQLPRYLLRDRDAIFGNDSREQVRDMGNDEVLSTSARLGRELTSSG
jgi:putative transposase